MFTAWLTFVGAFHRANLRPQDIRFIAIEAIVVWYRIVLLRRTIRLKQLNKSDVVSVQKLDFKARSAFRDAVFVELVLD
mgnify:CR=1 FL=1